MSSASESCCCICDSLKSLSWSWSRHLFSCKWSWLTVVKEKAGVDMMGPEATAKALLSEVTFVDDWRSEIKIIH